MENRFTILKPYGDVEWEVKEFAHLADIRNPHCDTEKALADEIRDVDLLLADVDIEVTEKVLESARKLRSIVCTAAGTDFIDLDAATRKGIIVTNIPDYCTNAVAEYTLALILCLCRHIIPGTTAVHDGNWENRRFFQGVEVNGKRLGLIGLGKIGTRVAQKCKALGMEIDFYSPSVSGEAALAAGYNKYDSLLELVKNADFISIHTSLRDQTRGILGENEFKSMKPTAYLINVARGAIVDEAALYRALKERWITGAAVDVLTQEPPERDNPLFQLENVIITPHIAWHTREADTRAYDQAKQIIMAIMNNQFPFNVVNPEVRIKWEQPL
jgi:D-3-phosphoglycerate dehydrogenase